MQTLHLSHRFIFILQNAKVGSPLEIMYHWKLRSRQPCGGDAIRPKMELLISGCKAELQ